MSWYIKKIKQDNGTEDEEVFRQGGLGRPRWSEATFELRPDWDKGIRWTSEGKSVSVSAISKNLKAGRNSKCEPQPTPSRLINPVRSTFKILLITFSPLHMLPAWPKPPAPLLRQLEWPLPGLLLLPWSLQSILPVATEILLKHELGHASPCSKPSNSSGLGQCNLESSPGLQGPTPSTLLSRSTISYHSALLSCCSLNLPNVLLPQGLRTWCSPAGNALPSGSHFSMPRCQQFHLHDHEWALNKPLSSL